MRVLYRQHVVTANYCIVRIAIPGGAIHPSGLWLRAVTLNVVQRIRALMELVGSEDADLPALQTRRKLRSLRVRASDVLREAEPAPFVVGGAGQVDAAAVVDLGWLQFRPGGGKDSCRLRGVAEEQVEACRKDPSRLGTMGYYFYRSNEY